MHTCCLCQRCWYHHSLVQQAEKSKGQQLQSLFLNSCSSPPQRESEQRAEMPKLGVAREGGCDPRGNCRSSGLALLPSSFDTLHLLEGIRRREKTWEAELGEEVCCPQPAVPRTSARLWCWLLLAMPRTKRARDSVPLLDVLCLMLQRPPVRNPFF